ncbi:MAG: adenylate/guanylate cyclase domain-containing protein [Armatimonadetes bacterium]|nr:adenylate/guanylate cyclase domain-containing protein [Armatimonadota bacterium]
MRGFLGLQHGSFNEPIRNELTEDGVQQMLDLAERLRAASGGELDDAAILAVSEATGAPVEYVRLAIRLRPEEKKKSFAHRVRSEYLGLDPEVRRYVIGGLIGTGMALISVLSTRLSSVGSRSFDGVLGVLQIVLATIAIYFASTSKDSRSAAIVGAIASGVGFTMFTIFKAVGLTNAAVEPTLLIPITIAGALAGLVANKLVAQNRKKLGLKDPLQERHELLRQLVELQDKLRSGEQAITFLSLDIVGSTKMKEHADPLSIEYTFNEYHQFVDRIARKYGGRVHSTAGDGVTCAFDTPMQAFGAAKNVQAGMLELNTFGNKTGIPLSLRAGIHSGTVVPPKPGDIASLNFAHVIDIAAHLQKVSPVGGIVISEVAANTLPGGAHTVGIERIEAQNVTGIIWQSKATGPVAAPSEPPPFPGNE